MSHRVKQSLVKSRIDFFYYAFRNILLASIPLLIISALTLSFPHSSADNNTSSDSLSISISSACTLSSSIDRAHTVNVNAGTHAVDIGSTRVNAYCNDNNGYSIYAIGNSNNVDGNTDLISSINDNYNIKTGIYDEGSSSSLTPSSWGMKLAPGTGTGLNPETGASIAITPPTIVNNYDNYNVVPNNYTLVASRASGTNMTIDTDITGSYFTTTYDVYASSVQPAGTYNGKVKYLMVHPISDHTTITFEDAFARAGKQPIAISSGTYYKMQDMTSDICSQVAYDTTTELVDIRDNKPYYVTKLKDNHCWMTQNLDFDIDTTKTYTHNDTDLGWDTANFDANATWTPDTTNGKYNLQITGTAVSNWSNQNNYPYSADPGDVYYYTSNSSDNDIKYTSLSDCTLAGHTAGECKHYHAGNYYNWTAAIASNNSSGISADKARADNSICPRGWRLPNTDTVDSNYNEFGRLLYGYNITNNKANGTNSVGFKTGGLNAIRISPLYFTRSGFIDGWQLVIPGSAGYYWSNTINSSTNAYDLGFGSNIYPARSDFRNLGWSIRCLAR